jgi:hypothetical protein
MVSGQQVYVIHSFVRCSVHVIKLCASYILRACKVCTVCTENSLFDVLQDK